MSEWRERANRRRDERQTAVPVIRPPSGSKKDTKKWCRGKVGKPHTPVCKPYASDRGSIFANWRILACSECGKQIDYYYPVTWKNREHRKPEWVTF